MGVPYVSFTIKDGVAIGGTFNSYTTYGLILTNQDIGLPKPRTNYITIEGRDGSLDMSELYDTVFYDNRTLTFTFSTVNSIYDWDELRTKIANDLHGKTFLITIYSDERYQYEGRCSIDKYQSSKGLGTITIKCNCYPFKTLPESININFKLGADTPVIEKSFTISGLPVRIHCVNSGSTGDMAFQIDNEPVEYVGAGSWKYYSGYSGYFEAGEHTVRVQGTGNARIWFDEKFI